MVLIKLMRDRVVQVTAASLPALLAFQNTSILSPLIPFLFKHIEANYGDIIVLWLQALVWGVYWLEGALFLLPLFELVSYLRGTQTGGASIKHLPRLVVCLPRRPSSVFGLWWWFSVVAWIHGRLQLLPSTRFGSGAGVVMGPPGLDWSTVGDASGRKVLLRCGLSLTKHQSKTIVSLRLYAWFCFRGDILRFDHQHV